MQTNSQIVQSQDLEIVVTRADGYVENYGKVCEYELGDTPVERVRRNITVRLRQYRSKVRFFFGRRWYRYQKGLSPWRITTSH